MTGLTSTRATAPGANATGANATGGPARLTPLRRAVPYLLLPLSLIACALASSPWLRAFPSGVLAVPLFGAALLSVLLPVVVVGIGLRKLWLTALIDLVGFAFFTSLVALRELAGFADLYRGLVHGPSQVLTYALPLVSPRTLLVAPVALCWLSGAIIGECVARGWQSVVPYATVLVTFGLAYAGTARAISSSSTGRRYDTLLAGALLLTLLLLRAAQSWVQQDVSAETTQPDGVLPARGLVIGSVLSLVIALAAAGVVQASAFSGPATAPARVPPLDNSKPLTPLSFVAGLRPENVKSAGKELFKVSTDGPSSNYIGIADVDFYDGDGWSFSRTFRPSGGVIPAESDPEMRAPGRDVTQTYTIDKGALTSTPWMPFLYRPQNVTGLAVNIDVASGMIVPSRRLTAGERYTVRSATPTKSFDQLSKSSLVATSLPPIDTQVPGTLGASLGPLVTTLATETKTPSSPSVPFLQAVTRDLRANYALSGTPGASTSATPAPSTSSARRSTSAAPSADPSDASGGTSFADVLGSLLQAPHAGTPEQFATLVALVARQLGVPARVVTGFRVPPAGAATTLPEGTYSVTTADAWTWVEIPVRGQGWVVLDAAPGKYAGQQPKPSNGAEPSATPSLSPASNALVTQANKGGHAVAPKSKVPGSKAGTTASVLEIVLIAIVALIVIILLILISRKRWRARRRRSVPDPRLKLLGAWQESLDVLSESGLPDLTYLTSAEVAAATYERFGGEPAAQARYLGDSANAAIFSPASWVGPADADAAWRGAAVLRKTVRRRLSVPDRVGAGLRYNRPARARTLVGPDSWASAARARALALGTRAGSRRRRGSSAGGRRRRVH